MDRPRLPPNLHAADRFLASARPAEPIGGEALDRLYVRIEHFASVLQEKYGLSRGEAMRKIAALKRVFHEE